MRPLRPGDFPLKARDGQIYPLGGGTAVLGPLPEGVANDLVVRLNRDAAMQATAEQPTNGTENMLVGPNLGRFPAGDGC